MSGRGDYNCYTRRKDPRRKGVFSITCLKCILFIFNFIFLASGCAIMGVAAWTLQSRQQQLLLLASASYVTVAALFILAGIIVFIVTFFGCIAVAREDRCYLLMYTFGLLLVFLLEAIGGILAYVYQEHLFTDLSHSITNTFNDNYGKEVDFTSAIDEIQLEFVCCGGLSYSDWSGSYWKVSGKAGNNSVPWTCCKSPSPDCGIRDHPSNIWHNGCIHKLEKELSVHLLLLGAIGLGFSAIQIIGLIFSCCLYVKLKNLDDLY